MPQRNIDGYRRYLQALDYPEYAHSHARRIAKTEKGVLDLSSWRDTIHPDMVNAIRQSVLSVSQYQMAQDAELIDSISTRLGYAKKRISIVGGADDALRLAAQYCIRPGTKVLIPVPSFGRYEYHAYINEADIHFLAFSEYPFAFDVDKIAQYAKKKNIECIFIASPNSPTGGVLSKEELRRLAKSTNASIIFDESLISDPSNAVPTSLLNECPNIFVCGSFSKLYSLAGARIGYLVAHDTHQSIRALISPFEVNSLSIVLAKFALSKEEWTEFKAQNLQKGLEALKKLKHPDLRLTPTEAPVALLEYTKRKHRLYTMLQRNGIKTVSAQSFRGLQDANAVRIIIRNERDTKQLIRRLKSIL